MRRRYGREEPVRFDLVAHSMGSLVARHYLYYGRESPPAEGVPWKGAEGIEKVVLIAPPNAGSVDAVSRLVEGADYSFVLPHFEAAMLGTFPSVYQLLPRQRHGALAAADGIALDPLDLAVWKRNHWGLLDPAQAGVLAQLLPDVSDAAARAAIAEEHVAKSLQRAREVQEALDRPARVPPSLSLHLLAGDAVPTLAKYRVAADGRLQRDAMQPGDGLVTRASALLDERQGAHWQPRLNSPLDWKGVVFLQGDHLGLMDTPAFVDNLLYTLLEKPAP